MAGTINGTSDSRSSPTETCFQRSRSFVSIAPVFIRSTDAGCRYGQFSYIQHFDSSKRRGCNLGIVAYLDLKCHSEVRSPEGQGLFFQVGHSKKQTAIVLLRRYVEVWQRQGLSRAGSCLSGFAVSSGVLRPLWASPASSQALTPAPTPAPPPARPPSAPPPARPTPAPPPARPTPTPTPPMPPTSLTATWGLGRCRLAFSCLVSEEWVRLLSVALAAQKPMFGAVRLRRDKPVDSEHRRRARNVEACVQRHGLGQRRA